MATTQLRIPSDHRFLEPAQVLIERIGRIAGVEEDELTSLSIAVMELVKNGMEHGNGLDPEKRVSIAMEALPGRVVVEVEDEGSWVPAEGIGLEPAEGEALMADRGRGILIARNLARWLDFSLSPEGRTRVTLIWPLS
ncbi:ATP-binding protein [Candidatus Fermentibacterales bacterium]|nr:ATP-binding protein [Candidatus Fermentibacterales bacterium]